MPGCTALALFPTSSTLVLTRSTLGAARLPRQHVECSRITQCAHGTAARTDRSTGLPHTTVDTRCAGVAPHQGIE
eukprot:4025102-Prymnesium_polylepis.1